MAAMYIANMSQCKDFTTSLGTVKVFYRSTIMEFNLANHTHEFLGCSIVLDSF